MFPELFHIGNYPVRSYGVLLVIGVLFAIALAKRRAPVYGLKPEAIWDSSMWLVIPGILGARIFYIAQNWGYYQTHRNELFSLRFEGLTSFGGLVFGFLGFLAWRAKAKVPFWSFLDTVGVPVLVAQAMGRVGCLLNGCCYGRPTEAWYGVHFQNLDGRHAPAQLVDTALMLLGALFITLRERKSPLRPGASFGLFLVCYGISRFVYEIFRAGTKAEVASGIASSAYIGNTPITSAQLATFGFMVLGLVCIVIGANQRSAPVPLTD